MEHFFVITQLIFMLIVPASIGGYILGRNRNKHRQLEFDTPDSLINYLEACAVSNPDMTKLLNDVKSISGQKLLTTPEWYYDPKVKMPPEEHWKLFLSDLNRETGEGKVGVVRHWFLERRNNFSYKEIDMILQQFDDNKDRIAVRGIYAQKIREGNED